MTVLVTGATGNVGREVVRALRAKGAAVRAADRRPARVTSMFGADVAPVRLDFFDGRTFGPALEGCSTLFLLRPPPISDVKTTLIPFVDAARTHGVRHVVFLSVAGADTNRIVPHHAVERHLARRSDDWTVLRPGFFAQNLGDAYRRDIVNDHRLYVPAGGGRVAFVDVRDIAEVAAAALVEPASHKAKGYTLTGPAAVTFDEIATLLSEALDRTIRYDRASIAGYAWHLHRQGMAIAQVTVQTVLHVGLRLGQAETLDPTLPALLGRSSRTVRQYVFDHRATWREPAAPAD